ncbi:phosphoribosyl-AMP cyclohydrolase [Methylophaga muralis]|uniref:phosphoribosyl-AMP cyclohydrolase n=1 Tax=Methylophaga muralis TaxID=291169 RepID=A0A1E3GQ16_9GAMM|nr:phosphoribosyl-AMP cyclohydrolase [Methylophaga muralis]
MIETLEKSAIGTSLDLKEVLATLPWNTQGLINAIAQQHDTGEVLMLAWMNQEALLETIDTGKACYWSRSRQCLWRKGETSAINNSSSRSDWIAMAMRCCCWSSKLEPLVIPEE